MSLKRPVCFKSGVLSVSGGASTSRVTGNRVFKFFGERKKKKEEEEVEEEKKKKKKKTRRNNNNENTCQSTNEKG
ncbi:hypothetical protein M8J75_001049 [Diaphorina citri]|nr:hypothetical protein M8J75_001049 [Diaphorina citri]